MKLFIVVLVLITGCSDSHSEVQSDGRDGAAIIDSRDTVSEPVMVGGAFLACFYKGDSEVTELHCRMEDEKGRPIVTQDSSSLRIMRADEVLDLELIPSFEQGWQWSFTIPTGILFELAISYIGIDIKPINDEAQIVPQDKITDVDLDDGGDIFHLMFVTHQAVVPEEDFEGLEDADEICNEEAESSGIERNFIAMLSTSERSLDVRLEFRGKVLNLNNEIISNNKILYTDKIDGRLISTADGKFVANDKNGVETWSGTGKNGKVKSKETCDDWTSSEGKGLGGLLKDKGKWLSDKKGDCDTPKRLLCISK